MNPNMWLLVAILLLCVALSAFFSASETSYAVVNRVRLKNMAADGKRGAQKAIDLAEQYDRLLTTILIGNNIVNTLAASIGTVLFTGLAGNMGPTLSTIVITLVVLTFGEITPKTLAKKNAEAIAVAVAEPLRVLMIVFTPLDKVFSLLRNSLMKRFVHEEESHIEDELMTMVDEAQHEGDMDVHEGELIRSAIEFNDQDAQSILTPRVDITAIEDTATMEEAAEVLRESGYSRVPVYHEDMDHVVGILHEKDFYVQKHAGCNDICQIMKPPVWAPSTLKISKLLKMFQSSKTHMVILLDEFGGTEGLVTMEDVLEELVGEIYDEHDDVSEEITAQPDGSWSVDGSMQLSDLLEKFHIKDDYEADTVGGWAAEVLGRIPKVGDTFEADHVHGEVIDMDKRRVTRLNVVFNNEDEQDEENERG
jgi:putative hemolysin